MHLGSRDRSFKVPRHIWVIPDGNRRWAEAKGLPRARGYAAGGNPGLRMLDSCRQLGVEEVTAYGFTREKRPAAQVHAFRDACVTLAVEAVDAGAAALLVVGEHRSSVFPDELRPFTGSRAPGDIQFNLLINADICVLDTLWPDMSEENSGARCGGMPGRKPRSEVE